MIKATHIAKHHAAKFIDLNKYANVAVSSSGDVHAGKEEADMQKCIDQWTSEEKKHFIIKQTIAE